MNHPLTPLQPCLRQILDQPSFEGSAIRIELVHRSKHIQEYLPDRLFCFAIIVQGCAGDSEDQSTVPFKRQRQGIVAAHAQGGHAFGLRRTKLPVTEWPQLVETWLGTIGMIPE